MAYNTYYVGTFCSKVIDDLKKIVTDNEDNKITFGEACKQKDALFESAFNGSPLEWELFIALLRIVSEENENIVLNSNKLHNISSKNIDTLFRKLGIRGFQINGSVDPHHIIELHEKSWKIEGVYPNGRDYQGVVFEY